MTVSDFIGCFSVESDLQLAVGKLDCGNCSSTPEITPKNEAFTCRDSAGNQWYKKTRPIFDGPKVAIDTNHLPILPNPRKVAAYVHSAARKSSDHVMILWAGE